MMTQGIVGLVLDGVVAMLLAVTIGYCALLHRRLASFRSARDDMAKLVNELNQAISRAQSGVSELKSSSKLIIADLEAEVSRARGSIDELSVINDSGRRLAERIEAGLDSGLGLGEKGGRPERPAMPSRPQRGEQRNEQWSSPAGKNPRSEAERELAAALRLVR